MLIYGKKPGVDFNMTGERKFNYLQIYSTADFPRQSPDTSDKMLYRAITSSSHQASIKSQQMF